MGYRRRSVLLVLVCLGTGGCGSSEPEGLAPPIAKAGADRTVEIGQVVTLDGSESEPGGSLVYSWTVTAPSAGAVVVSGENSAVSTFVAQVEGVYVATLVVTNNGVDSAPSRAFVTDAAFGPQARGRAMRSRPPVARRLRQLLE